MSVYNQQQQMITKEAYMTILKNGIQPLTTRVQTLATRIKGKKVLGLPFFDPIKLIPDEVSDATQWNKQLREILWDLSTLFNETKAQGQQLMALSIYYSHERDRLNQLIKELNLKCAILEEQLDNPNIRGFTDSFISFDNVETIGNDAQGLPSTNAMVDLKRSSIRLPRLAGLPAKFDMIDAYIRVSGNGVLEQYGDIKNILSDSINDTWQCVLNIDGEENAVLTINVELKEPVMTNCIELEYENIGNVKVEINTVDQSTNTISFGDFLAWEMNSKSIDKLTIILTKDTPDIEKGYTFAIKHLCIKAVQFQDKAYMVTKKFPLDRINEILLKVDEIVPPQTNIRYYLSLEYKNAPFDWFEIKKDTSYVFDNVDEDFGLFAPGDDYYGISILENFGIKYYTIGIINHIPFANIIDVRAGERMWSVESIPLPNNINADYIPTVADWKYAIKVDKRVIDTDRVALALSAGNLYRLTTYIYCTSDLTPTSVMPNMTGGKFSLYVNSTRIQPVSGKYPLKFNKEWNKIEFFITAYETGNEFRHKLGLEVLSDTIFANYWPMQMISVHDLTCNTNLDDNNKFALLKKDDKYFVLVNFNPIDRDLYKQGCRFSYSYKYLDTDDELLGFRMMSILERTHLAEEVTCHLLGYKLLTK